MSTTREHVIHERRKILQNPHAYVDELEEISALKAMHRAHENPQAFSSEIEELNRPISRFDNLNVAPSATLPSTAHRRRTSAEIQNLALDIHKQIWTNRTNLFPDSKTRDPVDMLDPILALELLGYSVEIGGALGQIASSDRLASNVAGFIDQPSRQVFLSTGFPATVRNFTAAHELGHAMMHTLSGMHRDKPIEGSLTNRDPIEREADIFATFFLMPEKLLKQAFSEVFGAAPFILDEQRRFALAGAMPRTGWTPKNVRELSRLLSSTSRFNGINLTALATRFRVSVEAMAIRLEQLQLVSIK